MQIVVFDGYPRLLSEPLLARITAELGRYGIGVDRVRAVRQPPPGLDRYAALFATAEYPFEFRNRIPCYGKSDSHMPSRPETLVWLHDAGLPVMRWSLAADHGELDGLFDRWATDAVLVKRSGTFGGKSVTLFTRDCVPDIRWEPHLDIFCPEVNPNDGDIYKLELFGSTELLGWMSRVPAARTRIEGGRVDGLYGAYGRRQRFEWPESILEPGRRLGAAMLDRCFGHISLDFMRNPRGGFEVIEVNLGNVALWWNVRFRSFRRRYAEALHRVLVEKHGAPVRPAGIGVRSRSLLAGLARCPVVAYCQVRSGLWRRRRSRLLESEYGGARSSATKPT